MNRFIETHSASRGFAVLPPDQELTWHLSVMFQCPLFLKSSDLYGLAQLTLNVSRQGDGKAFYVLDIYHEVVEKEDIR